MPRRKNPKLPSPRDLAVFERVVVRGERQTSLARELKVSKQRISKICERVGQQVFRELAEDFSEHRQQTSVRLEHVYCEALAAWEKSKEGRRSETVTTNSAGGVMRSRTRQRASGDVQYLAEARQALADLRELCGLDATKTEILEVHESKTYRVAFDRLMEESDETLEEQATLARLVQQRKVRLIEAAEGEGSSDAEPTLLMPQHPSTLLR